MVAKKAEMENIKLSGKYRAVDFTYGSYNSVMSINRKAVIIYGSTDLWIYWDKADKLRLFYRDISHNLCAKRVV